MNRVIEMCHDGVQWVEDKAVEIGVAAGALALAGSASAAPVDLTGLTTAVDFSTATAAILTVAGALVVVYIAIKAVKFVMNMLKTG